MKRKIADQFLANYLLMFIISIVIAICSFLLLDFANHVISNTLVKSNHTAESLMQDNYFDIDTNSVIDNGGGVQVINKNYEIVLTAGLNTFEKDKLNTAEFTEFLTASKSKGIPFSYSIEYNAKEQFWLIVSFPTSIRIDFAIVHNKEFASVDMQNVVGVIVAIVLFYLILLAISTVIYSKITSTGIVNPLRKLCHSAQRLRDGDYSARVELDLKNEFGELEDIFNAMAGQIEHEISLRKQSEEKRKQLVLDISHDLKNPLASIVGYAEHCLNNPDIPKADLEAYLQIICENSVRANKLITDLFELSKMESSEFVLSKTRIDTSEYLRTIIGKAIPTFDKAGLKYDFEIPEQEIFAMLDTDQMDRVFQNLVANTVQYNPEGTKVTIHLLEQDDGIVMIFKDDGIGIAAEIAKNIFQPFVRGDDSRNSQTGGTGLGLAIVEKTIVAHGGTISLKTDINRGCEYIIQIPKI
ncbi:MAG: hypothetical protein CVU87_06425 [Firmicutes bacterium HGW-Firmicutes-12]|jgi:signal transduction histidine kinase|nr:MAG: hypothetical protein CVU87_06425 [Firmicutes bacterium HGW-Firmicutes-12]